MDQIANRQSLVFSERGQLSQAIPQFHVVTNTTPMNANRAIRIAGQRTQGLWGPHPMCLGGDMSTNASDSNRNDNSR